MIPTSFVSNTNENKLVDDDQQNIANGLNSLSLENVSKNGKLLNSLKSDISLAGNEEEPLLEALSHSTSASSSPEISPLLSPLSSDVSLGSHLDLALSDWEAPASKKSLRTHNPIRAIVDPIMSSSMKCGNYRSDGKDQISLALGDPTAYGIMEPCPAILTSIKCVIESSSMAAGYTNACGEPQARAAVAKYHSENFCNEHSTFPVEVAPNDVIIANGASGALELVLTALLDEDTVLLVPRPGFPLYEVIAESHGARVVHYDLLPDKGWECDLAQIEKLILKEEKKENNNRKRAVRGIIINNPSNPTGAVYRLQHLAKIVSLAEKYRLPIIADEIYGDMTLNGNKFYPIAGVVASMGRNVPAITISGMGKQYLVPGWRIGWAVFHDSNHGAIRKVKEGAQRLAQVILGASHLVQATIPAALTPSTQHDTDSINSWKAKLHSKIQNQADLLCNSLNQCHGLEVIHPQGAMYAMVRIEVEKFDDAIEDDISFMKILLEEENVVVLPGRAFGLRNDTDSCNDIKKYYVFRVVFCAPEKILKDVSRRFLSFCSRHKISENRSS